MRWVVRIFGILVVVALLAVGLVLLLPGDRIAKIAADQISQATGRTVTMSGDTTVTFYPILGISTGKVEVANADWSNGAPMLQAESLKVGIEPTALFGGDIRITGLEAVNPRILLERAADGRVNWKIGVEGVAPSGQSEGGTPAQSAPLALTLDRALITDAQLTYLDHAKGETTTFSDMDFDLRWPDYEGAATLEASARPAGQTVSLTGKLDKVGNFIAGGVSNVAATISAPGGKVDFNGAMGLQPQMGGRVTADLSSTAQFLAALGLPGVDVPEGFGRALQAQADVTLTEDMRVSLRDMTLGLGDNRLTGAADLFLGGAKPRLNAQLNAGALDLSRLAGADSNGGGQTGGGGGGGVVSQGWSKAPIDASGLALANGEVALIADSVNLGDLQLGKTRTLMTLDRSRAVFELREVRAYDGLVTGQFVANNRSGLSVGGQITANGINLESFLSDAMDISRFSATADGNLSFLGVGQSVHAIMNSLKGDGAVKTGRGVISGFDLDKLMRSGNLSGGTTVFDQMSATFNMAGGNLANNDLLMQLPLAKAQGKGRIGLGARDIDYLFTPTLLEGETRRGLAIPVRIRGPWANPKIMPDLEKAIDLNLKEEKKELKAKAERKLNRAIEKELGVTVQEGQSVEDALKDELGKKAAKELFKLFD